MRVQCGFTIPAMPWSSANDAYRDPSWPRLSNAVRDARAIAEALESKGFEVTLETDLNADALSDSLKDFFIRKGRDPQSRLFVWFAGHGHTMNGEGFLVPTDGPAPRDEVGFLSTAVSLRDFGKFVRYAKSKHVYAVFDFLLRRNRLQRRAFAHAPPPSRG